VGGLSDIGSRLIQRWDLDRAQLMALRSVQHRAGLGVADSPPTAGRPRSRLRTAAPFYFRFFLYAIFGLTGVAGVLFPSFFFGIAFSYTMIMLMFGLTLLGYFTTVLLDTSDNRILLHLPISGRTLLASRILCIVKYAGLLALSVSLPTAVALALRFGTVALLVFAVSIVLTLVLVVAATLAFCLFVLRYVNPERIRQGILYLETALFMLAIFAGSAVLNADRPIAQMMPDVSGEPWWYLYPPGWMAGLLDFAVMEKTSFNAVLAATAVLAPIVGFIGCMRLFAGGRFTALLARLEAVPRGSVRDVHGRTTWLAPLSARAGTWLNGGGEQRAVFALTSQLMKTDQSLKMMTYPYLGTILVYVGFVVYEFHGRAPQDVPLTAELTFFFCYYMPLFLAVMAPAIQHSPHWRAAWCYQVLPFSRPGVIFCGAMLAYVTRLIVPVYLLLMIVSAAIWGTARAVDVVFAGFAAVLVCTHRFWSMAPALPYSREPAANVTQKKVRLAGLAFIPLALGLIAMHAVLKAFAAAWGVVGGIVALGCVVAVAYRKVRSISPQDVGAPDRHVGWHRIQS
jgi:ABC-2 type transport system permease protein